MVVRRAATLAVSATMVAALLAGCSGSGGADDAEEATTTEAVEETTTTEAGPDLEALGADVQGILETVDEAIDAEATARDEFAAENDLDGAIDSTRDLRATLYDADAELRDLELPDDLSDEMNGLLTANGGYIDALDGFLELEDIPAYNDQLDLESDAREQWYGAADDLAAALEIDGVTNEVGGDGGTDDDPVGDDEASSSDEPIPAGEVAGDDIISMEVPEGFTADPGFPIEMTDANGNTIGVYEVFPDEGVDTLDAVAEAYATGAADKNGYEIIGGPESDDLGAYPAIGYAFAIDDATTGVELIFEGESSAGTRFHVISVVAADADVDAVMAALETVADTVTIG